MTTAELVTALQFCCCHNTSPPLSGHGFSACRTPLGVLSGSKKTGAGCVIIRRLCRLSAVLFCFLI